MSMNGTVARARVEQRSLPTISPVVVRIRAEYDEMPGLCLTEAQARRLCGLDAQACHAALASLVEAGYLRATPRGFVRA